jgi:hypothetical protein
MTDTDGTFKVHVRASELVAQLAISLPTDGSLKVMTFHSHGADGFSNRVSVKDTAWTTADVSAPTLVIKLANGQEFELECRHSSHELRTARLAVEHPVSRREREQDEATTARRAANKEG